jgi:signal transduction histidine kinase
MEVRDNGEGMSAEVVKRIFEPFFTTRFPGRGLGLAAVLGIARRHRGAIRVESVPGTGTAMRVLFPIQR